MQVRRSYPFSATSATAISSSSRFLGSAGTFEACAKFCYNTISTHKLVLLRCAAAHRGKLGTSSTPLSLPPPLEGQNSPCSVARSSASPLAACMPLTYSSPDLMSPPCPPPPLQGKTGAFLRHTASGPPARRRMVPRALCAVSPWLVGAGGGLCQWRRLVGSWRRSTPWPSYSSRAAVAPRTMPRPPRGRRAVRDAHRSATWTRAASSGTCIQDGYSVRRSLLDDAVSK
jgi:hypothetical protein